MNRVIESLHEYKIGNFQIRFWQAEESLHHGFWNRSQQAVAERYAREGVPFEAIEVALFLSELPYCNAVQVQDTDQPAILIYPEWP